MFRILSEYGPVCLVIMISALVMCGVRELIQTPIPGDREKQALLRNMRQVGARSQQQRQALLCKLAGVAEHDGRPGQVGKGKALNEWRLGDRVVFARSDNKEVLKC